VYNPDRKVIVADDFFPYVPRDGAALAVVSYLTERQTMRNAKACLTYKADKTNNPLVAILGSPGSGKSTFLTHFPASSFFKDYVNGSNVIVAPLTFNSAMAYSLNRKPAFGLRILFGAATAMNENSNLTWNYFCDELSSFSSLTGLEAVELLHDVFPSFNRLIVLVDELSSMESAEKTFRLKLVKFLTQVAALMF